MTAAPDHIGGAVGYIRLWRRLAENPVWTQLSPAVLKVMIGFLLKANWKQATWYDGSAEIEIPRGSFITSYPKMAHFCNLTPKKTRLAFDHLQRLGFAAYRRAPKWTLVTVLNYGSYQECRSDQGTLEGGLRARRGHDEGTTRAPIEEGKKVISKNTPLLPEGDGADAPLELVTFDDNKAPDEAPEKPAAHRKPYRDVLEQVARFVHGRHPIALGRRDLGVAGAEEAGSHPEAQAHRCGRGRGIPAPS